MQTAVAFCVVLAIVPALAALSGRPCSEQTGQSVDKAFHEWAAPRWAQLSDELSFRRLRAQSFAAATPAFTAGKFTGQGVVMFMNDRESSTAGYTAITRLRAVGNNLPVEVFHMGSMRPETQEEFAALPGVTVKDLTSFVNRDEISHTVGHDGAVRSGVQALSILHSSFAEALYLDANAMAVQNPASLFSSEAFTTTGLVFWPSTTKASPQNPIWSLLSTKCVDSFEQDGSIVLVNKEKAWAALNMATHLRSGFFQNLLNVDKDVFRMAAVATETPFEFVSTDAKVAGAQYTIAGASKFCAHSIVHHDTNGAKLFIRNVNSEVVAAGASVEAMSCMESKAEKLDAAFVDAVIRLQEAVPDRTVKNTLYACTAPTRTWADVTAWFTGKPAGTVQVSMDGFTQFLDYRRAVVALDRMSMCGAAINGAPWNRYACLDSTAAGPTTQDHFVSWFNVSSISMGRRLAMRTESSVNGNKGNETVIFISNGKSGEDLHTECDRDFGITHGDTEVYSFPLAAGTHYYAGVAWTKPNPAKVDVITLTFRWVSGSFAFSNAIPNIVAIAVAMFFVVVAPKAL